MDHRRDEPPGLGAGIEQPMDRREHVAVDPVVAAGRGIGRLHEVLDRPVGDHGIEPLVPLTAQVLVVLQLHLQSGTSPTGDLLRGDGDPSRVRPPGRGRFEDPPVSASDVEHSGARPTPRSVEEHLGLSGLGGFVRPVWVPFEHAVREVVEPARGHEVVEHRVARDHPRGGQPPSRASGLRDDPMWSGLGGPGRRIIDCHGNASPVTLGDGRG